MMETLCLRNEPKRYVVSIGNKVLLVTYDYHQALAAERDIVRRNLKDESFEIIVERGKNESIRKY